MTEEHHPAAIPQGPRQEGRWRYSDTVLVVGAGLVASIVAAVVVGLGAALGGTDVSSGELPSWQVFWIVLPAQFLGQLLALKWVSSRRGTGSISEDFGFSVNLKHWWYLPMGAALLFVTGILAQGLRVVLGIADEENPQELLDLVGDIGGIHVLAVVLGIGFAGPIIEEITFRGLLMRTAEERGASPTFVMVMTAAVFSLIHVTDVSLISLAGLPTLLALFLMGLVLAKVCQNANGNLAGAILLHCGFNLTSTIALFLAEAPA